MKAAVVQSIGNVVVAEVPEPVCGDYDVLCEIMASSICSGTDNHIVHGDKYQNPRYPLILGHEAIGRVIKLGAKVKNMKIGDIVTRIKNRLPADSGYHLQWGALAERGIATDWQAMRADGAEEDIWSRHTVHRVLPESIDSIEATMIITWRETYSFFKRLGLAAGDTVLIVGSGAPALSFVEHARCLGLAVVVIGSPRQENLFRSAGVRQYFFYQNADYADVAKFRSHAAIIDAVGASETVNGLLPQLRAGGRVGVYGLNEFGDYKLDIAKAPGGFAYESGEIYDEGSAHDDVIRLWQEGKLDPWRYLSREHVYPLEKVGDALEACRTRKVLKSVVQF